ncbi:MULTISPECIES: NAD-dependent epimerase/dehydratase family protein [Bacteria]|jgi:dTDP-6-deoxy-L-talose 4-dehydrogenase (NAD+)
MGSRVVVTGANGYLGRHVVEALLARGDEVVTVSRSADPWLVERVGEDRVINRSAFDLTTQDWDVLADADALVHLAWRDGFVLRSRAHGEDLSSHYSFLMDAADRGVKRIAPIGTMHEIGYWEGPVDAETPSNATTPYGIAKNSLRELLTASLPDTTALAWLRCYYIIGDDARSQSIFKKMLDAVDRNEREFPFTSGKNLYDFIDIDVLARQIAAAAIDSETTGVVECSTGRPRTLADAVEGFIRERELPIRLAYGAFPDRPFDSPGLWGDSTRIEEIMARQQQIRESP